MCREPAAANGRCPFNRKSSIEGVSQALWPRDRGPGPVLSEMSLDALLLNDLALQSPLLNCVVGYTFFHFVVFCVDCQFDFLVAASNPCRRRCSGPISSAPLRWMTVGHCISSGAQRHLSSSSM